MKYYFLLAVVVSLLLHENLHSQVVGISVKGGRANILRGPANDSPIKSTYWGVDFSYDLENVKLKHYLVTAGLNTWNYSASPGVSEVLDIDYLQVPIMLMFHKGFPLQSKTLHGLAGVGIAFDFPYNTSYVANGKVPADLDKTLIGATMGAEIMYFLSNHLALGGEINGHISLSKIEALERGVNRYINVRLGVKLSCFFNGN
ncbi:MAG: hypothetical protein R2825_25000 [Saprospiraceae bacterium]